MTHRERIRGRVTSVLAETRRATLEQNKVLLSQVKYILENILEAIDEAPENWNEEWHYEKGR
ncbi:MAG: hypothetical protein IKH15_12070 [Bacteroidales bacterium]|nr:hypothetical protein [Bacteroidales bacterium]